MARPTREQIAVAIFNLVSGSFAWQTTSRRLRLWGDVGLDEMPAFFQTQGEAQQYVYSSGTIYGSLNRKMRVRLWCYINAKDPSLVGATQLNNIQDAIDSVIFPSGADAPTGKNTLGGLVDSCRIANVPLFDAGDLDGIGLLITDCEIWMP